MNEPDHTHAACRHMENPDTLWTRLREAESAVARLQYGCRNASPGDGGEICRLYVDHDGTHSDGYGAEWSDPNQAHGAPTTQGDRR